MPKGKKGYTTPHISIPITNPRRNIPSHGDQQVRYRLQCSVLDLFHSEIQGPLFLSVGPDAKFDMLKTFDLSKNSLNIKTPQAYLNHSRVQEAAEERKVKVK